MLQPTLQSDLADAAYLSSLEDRSDLLHYQPEAKLPPPKAIPPSIFAAIDLLEEKILDSPRVPLTGKTMVNEEELLETIDTLRLSLPEVIATAQEIIHYKERIIKEAQQQVQQILAEANQRAYQVANELGIIDRAEQEARQLRHIALAECEQLRQQTSIEIDRLRSYHIQEMERMRENVRNECQHIQAGADEYADRVLHNLEDGLTDVLQTIQRGRQRLNTDYDPVMAPQSEK
jgi:cell division septum initiation protein DivIVA